MSAESTCAAASSQPKCNASAVTAVATARLSATSDGAATAAAVWLCITARRGDKIDFIDAVRKFGTSSSGLAVPADPVISTQPSSVAQRLSRRDKAIPIALGAPGQPPRHLRSAAISSLRNAKVEQQRWGPFTQTSTTAALFPRSPKQGRMLLWGNTRRCRFQPPRRSHPKPTARRDGRIDPGARPETTTTPRSQLCPSKTRAIFCYRLHARETNHRTQRTTVEKLSLPAQKCFGFPPQPQPRRLVRIRWQALSRPVHKRLGIRLSRYEAKAATKAFTSRHSLRSASRLMLVSGRRNGRQTSASPDRDAAICRQPSHHKGANPRTFITARSSGSFCRIRVIYLYFYFFFVRILLSSLRS